jgi:hypothetical protein
MTSFYLGVFRPKIPDPPSLQTLSESVFGADIRSLSRAAVIWRRRGSGALTEPKPGGTAPRLPFFVTPCYIV